MGMHSVGLGLCQVQLTYLLPHIARDERDGGLHFGHHTLGFLDPLQAWLAEAFLVSNDADRVDVLLDIPGNELAVATYTALQVDKVIGMAEATDTLGDQRALRSETLVLVLRCRHILGSLLQAWRRLWRAAWTTFGRLAVGVGKTLVDPLERLFRLRHSLGRRSRCDSQRRCDRFAPLLLHLEEVR